MKRKSYILLGSPREIEERKEPNINKFDFLLINVGGACNHKCFMCWTHNNTYPIKNKSFLTDKELTSLIGAFHKLNGRTIAIMSDGESLFSENLKITKKIVELTGKVGMNVLIFTNGELLTKEMIKEFVVLNPDISFSLSLNATTKKTYERIHGVKGSFDRVIKNFDAWKDFCKRTNKKIGNNKILTQFDIHFVATEINLKEIPKIQKITDELDCALIITSPGMSGRALLNVDNIAKDLKSLEFLEEIARKLSDTEGPTAKTYEQRCGYICSQHHFCSLYGITVHSLAGMILPCPYFVGIGSEKWFELKQYLSQGGKDVVNWLVVSVKIISKISDALFDVFGYNYCLKRHPKYFEIEEFMDNLNKVMKKKTRNLKISSGNYFEKIMIFLDESIRNLSEEYKKYGFTKLDLIDRKILYELDIDARRSTDDIAQKISASKPIVDYRLRKLIELGFIQKFYAVYDTSKLGYTTYKIFISLQKTNVPKIEEIIRYIKNHSHVQFFISCDGQYDLAFNVLAKDILELGDIMKRFENKYGKFIAEKESAKMIFSSFFFRDYLLPGVSSKKIRKPMHFGSRPKTTKIDSTDIEILHYLGLDARMSVEKLSKKIDKSSDVIEERIKKLEKSQIVQNYVLLPDTPLLNQVSYKVLFSLHRLRSEREKKFFQFCKDHPNIWFHSKLFGRWDLEINMDVDDPGKFRQILMEIRSKFSDIIKEVNTLQVSRVHKFNFYPFKI